MKNLRTVLIVLAASLFILGACSEEQRRDIEGAGIQAVLEDATEDALDAEDIEIDELDCEADIDDDSAVTGSCTGTTVDDESIEANLVGTVDVDEATCESTLTVSVDGAVIDEDPEFDCLDS